MISRHVIQMLLAAPSITAIVGQRINNKKVPQYTDIKGDGPYLVLGQVSAEHQMSTKGPIGFQWADIAMTGHALTPKQADSIIDAVRTFLKTQSATIPFNVTAGTVTITVKGIFEQADEQEDWLPSPHMDESGVHTAGCTYRFWSTEES